MYKIRYIVYRGVTVPSEGVLEQDGKPRYFDNWQTAHNEVVRLIRQMNGPDATATFSYTVESA